MAKRLTDYASCAGCAGKLSPNSITQLLTNLPRHKHPNLLVGTETHDDAGVYQLRDDIALVQTVDFFAPLVDDPFVFGQIATTNALSDVYAMGGTPLTALNLVAYPDDELTPEWLGKILEGGAERCQAAGCTIVGGHSIRDTGIKYGLAVTGTIHPKKVFTNANAKPGDVLVLTKPLGTSFIVTAAKKASVPDALLKAACNSMTTLNDGARDAMIAAGANAATDVTGFGLAGHAYEMASGSNVAITIHIDKLPVFDGLFDIDLMAFRSRASKSNRAYVEPHMMVDDVNPLALEIVFDAQTSGGLLISVPAKNVDVLVSELKKRGTLAAAVIGEVKAGDAGLRFS